MLKRRIGRALDKKRFGEDRIQVSCEDLSRVLCFQGKQSDSVVRHGGGDTLEGCVQWSLASGSDNERGWDVLVLCVKNINILITDGREKYHTDHDAEIRYGLSDMAASLHLENCHFSMDNIWETGIKFVPEYYDSDLGESLSFVGNTGACEFSFPDQSDVVFDQNSFAEIVVKRYDDEASKRNGLSLTFKRNKIRKLSLDIPFPFRYPINFRFVGGNEIDDLTWDQIVNRREFDPQGNVVKYDDLQEYNSLRFSFGRSEKIGRRLLDTRYINRYGGRLHDMRDLFVKFKSLAHVRGDKRQENTIDSFVSLIEYAQLLNEKWYRSWQGWQDWLLLGWRGVSSRFFMSWLRPIIWLVGGYLILNSIPFCYLLEKGVSFDFDRYWEFCFLSPIRILFYADCLKDVLGVERYGEVLGGINTGSLNAIGIVRLLWIALCSYAFRNAIKTYGSK